MEKFPHCNCDSCPLKSQPFVPPEGPEDARVLILGQAPAYDEVRLRRPFVGVSGKLLDVALHGAGLKREQIRIDNTVLCLVPPGQKPPPEAIAACAGHVREVVQRAQVLVPMGNEALQALAPKISGTDYFDGRGIMSHAGYIERLESGQIIMPLIHPSYYLRQAPDAFRDFVDSWKTLTRVWDERTVLPSEREIHTHIPKSPKEAIALLMQMQQDHLPLAVDLESENADLGGANILSVTIADGNKSALVLPWWSDYLKQHNSEYLPLLEDIEVYQALQDCLESIPGIIAHNGLFDASMLRREGINVRVIQDTMLQHHALDERRGAQGLEKVVRQFLGIRDWSEQIPNFVGKGYFKPFSIVPPDVLFPYSAKDACYEWELSHLQDAMLKDGPRRLYETKLLPWTETLVRRATQGVAMSKNALMAAMEDMPSQLDKLREQMRQVSGEPFLNPQSPKQLNSLLYDAWKLPVLGLDGKPARDGTRSTNKAILEVLREKYPYDDSEGTEEADAAQPKEAVFLQKLNEHKQLAKVFNTYHKEGVKIFRGGRGHFTMSIGTTVTGRGANALFLVMPRESRGDIYKSTKDVFIADPGSFLLQTDYMAHEVRVTALLSADPWLTETVRNPSLDWHGNQAGVVWPEYLTEQDAKKKKELRQMGKIMNFKIQYGGGAKGVADQFKLSVQEGQRLIDKYFAPMPKVKQFNKEAVDFARKHGYAENIFGRRRRFPLRTQDNDAEIDRQVINFHPQSVANDINLEVFSSVDREIDFGYALWPVHDSGLYCIQENVTEQELQWLLYKVTKRPQELMHTDEPFYIDCAVGYSWGSMTKCHATSESILETLEKVKQERFAHAS